MIQLCRACHTRLHEGGFRVDLADDGTATFFDAKGQRIAATTPLPAVSDATCGASDGIVPWPGQPWSALHLDYGYVVSALLHEAQQPKTQASDDAGERGAETKAET